jgi:phosphatidylserine/phosphatidylglycerophosphate/cardiolipin synthase-like enzyme/uncharacterized membrane protein YdjX (TVP38/TMEM64 family)
MTTSLFRPGHNCCAVARAERLAFLIDAEAYYQQFLHAASRAERSLFIIGWDFDSRIEVGEDEQGRKVKLGKFLNQLAAAKPHLNIRILDWDFPVFYGTDREIPPTYGLGWEPHPRIEFVFDDTAPVAGSHHQKIVVVDDKVAFCGGLDLASKRWDTPAHKPDDPRRVFNGEAYPPMHDVQVAVSGPAAAELSRIAAQRWLNATGERYLPVKASGDPWPAGLQPDLEDVEVGIACTEPARGEKDGVRHIERLYLDMIAKARSYIYIENQYFTSKRIADALARRLQEPDGPEIVLLSRLLSHGWLEEQTMTKLRGQFVRELRDADKHGRFHALYPHVEGLKDGTCLDLHSKVMIVDDEWARVGSSNISNRSMGMDTECDVVVEARGDERVRAVIRRFRDTLLAEHMGVEREALERETGSSAFMGAALEKLKPQEASPRCLKGLDCGEDSVRLEAIAVVGDPEEPIVEGIVHGLTPPPARKFPLARFIVGGIVVAAIALALLWTETPLAEYVTRDNAMKTADWFADKWWAPLLILAAYTPASFVMFPRWIITMTAVIAFGPWKGFVLGMAGCVVAAVATFLPGRFMKHQTAKNLAGPRLNRIAHIVERRGILAVTLIRLVPVAPFPVVNMVLGALRVRLRHLVFGTMLGMLPGMLAATVLSDQLAMALEDPARVNLWLVGAVLLAIAGLAWFGQRVLRQHA